MKRIVVEGVVGHGRRLGRELGFPTANLTIPADAQIPDGVYRSRVQVLGRWYDAMSNVGHNPSVGGRERRIETHLFDFNAELYDHLLRVELLEHIREERRFSTIEQLREQIAKDKETIMKLIKA